MLPNLTVAASLSSILLLSPNEPPQSADPAALLKASADACRSLHSARYHAIWEVRDDMAPQSLEGDVAFLRWPVEVETPPPPPSKPAADGSIPATPLIKPMLKTMYNADLRIERADAELRTFNHDRAAVWNPTAGTFKVMTATDGGEQLILGDATVMLLSTPLLQPETLDKLAKPTNLLKLNTRENVRGVECDVVTARLPKPDAASDVSMTIAIGVADHLPRRTVFEQFTDGRSTVRHTVTITALQPNAEVDASMFTFEPPQGVTVEAVKPEPPPQMLTVGESAPQFQLKDAMGKTVSLSDFKDKIVLIDFWGTWCGPCKMAMPSIQKVHAKYNDKGVMVIGISCREKPGADPAKTMQELGCDYGLLLNGETIVKDWHVPGFPTLYVIDRQGRIAHAELGFDEDLESKLSEAIDALLKQ